jgi:hypothetical protein
MAKREDGPQGIIDGKKIFGAMRTVADPDGKAVIAGAGRDVARKDAADNKPRPAQPIKNRQDWHRG